MAASAKRNHRAPGEAKLIPRDVFDDDVIADNAVWAVIIADYFRVILIAHLICLHPFYNFQATPRELFPAPGSSLYPASAALDKRFPG